MPAAFNEGGFLLLSRRDGGGSQLGPKRLEFLDGNGVQCFGFLSQHDFAETDSLIGEEDRLGDQLLALVHLCQAIVTVEVLWRGQSEFLEDLFCPRELMSLQRVQPVIPPVDVIFFLERSEIGEFLPHPAEVSVQGRWRWGRAVVAAWHSGIVP